MQIVTLLLPNQYKNCTKRKTVKIFPYPTQSFRKYNYIEYFHIYFRYIIVGRRQGRVSLQVGAKEPFLTLKSVSGQNYRITPKFRWAHGGPRSQVCARLTLRSAPHRHEKNKFCAHLYFLIFFGGGAIIFS